MPQDWTQYASEPRWCWTWQSTWTLLTLLDERRRRRHAGRHGQDLVSGAGHQHGVLPLGRQAVVARDDGPAIRQLANLAASGIDHRFDGEDHAFDEFDAGAGLAIVQH